MDGQHRRLVGGPRSAKRAVHSLPSVRGRLLLGFQALRTNTIIWQTGRVGRIGSMGHPVSGASIKP